jgi:hypothetical protein
MKRRKLTLKAKLRQNESSYHYLVPGAQFQALSTRDSTCPFAPVYHDDARLAVAQRQDEALVEAPRHILVALRAEPRVHVLAVRPHVESESKSQKGVESFS